MSTREQTRAYYDKHASRYDRRTGFAPGTGQAYNFARYFEPFLDRALPDTGRLLEIGCGTGFYTRWFAARGLSVVAMDLSPNMIEQAKLRCPSSVFFAVGNCEEPAAVLDRAMAEDGFDFIVGVNTFSYYPNKRKALACYRQLLRDDGRLVLLDVNGNAYTQRLAYLTNFREARGFAENIGESTRANLCSMLEDAAFTVESFDRMSFMPNAVNKLGATVLAPFDWLMSRLPLVDAFAIRIAVVAKKA
jgi:SAM-dependent methyltransferase